MTRILLLLVSVGLLAACGDDTTVDQQQSDGRTARGEVLGGTISDEMLPLDTRKSQSPPLREEKSGSDSSEQASPSANPGTASATVDEPTNDEGAKEEESDADEG